MNYLRKPFNYTFFHASLYLILINALIFALSTLIPNINLYFGLSPIGFVYKKMLWQPLTYMFAHGSLSHLISNMLGLLFFALPIEKAIGSKEFLLFYFLTGIFSGLLSLGTFLITNSYASILIGASGAVYAIMLAFAVIFPKSTIYVFGIIPVSAPILVIIYGALEFFNQFAITRSNISHTTHLFGLVVAWLYFLIRMGINPIKIWKNALH